MSRRVTLTDKDEIVHAEWVEGDEEKRELVALLIGYRHLVRRQTETAPNGGNLAYWEREARRTETALRKLKGLGDE